MSAQVKKWASTTATSSRKPLAGSASPSPRASLSLAAVPSSSRHCSHGGASLDFDNCGCGAAVEVHKAHKEFQSVQVPLMDKVF